MASVHGIKTPIPVAKPVLVEVPAPYVLLVTINQPKQMNSLSVADCWEMDRVWRWFDEEPELYELPKFLIW